MEETKPRHAGYENLVIDCPLCGYECIFNRASDLGTTKPIPGRDVCCTECGERFWFSSDSVNERHESLLYDCYELFKRKCYMNCILNVSQAYEMFFNLYLKVELLYKPFAVGSDRDTASLKYMNHLSKELGNRVMECAFSCMRNIFLDRVTQKTYPANLCEAAEIISTLDGRKFPRNRKLEAIGDAKLAKLLIDLKETKINKLRNAVVHKIGYRPTRVEAENAIREARSVLFPLTAHLDLHEDVMWYYGRSA